MQRRTATVYSPQLFEGFDDVIDLRRWVQGKMGNMLSYIKASMSLSSTPLLWRVADDKWIKLLTNCAKASHLTGGSVPECYGADVRPL